jgi:lipopolysaccharide transport system permease protein
MALSFSIARFNQQHPLRYLLEFQLTTIQYLTLIDTLARFHLRGEARQFYLGYFWWLLEPSLYIAVFYIVFKLLLDSHQANYLYFLAVGKLTFIWFSKSVVQASSSIETNKGLISQVTIRKEVFPLAAVQQGFYRQLAVFSMLLVLLFLSGKGQFHYWFWLLPLMFVQMILICGASLLAALVVCWHKDFQHLIQLGMMFLLFVSGVFWDVNAVADTDVKRWLLFLNPLATLIDAYRQILLLGSLPKTELMSVLLCQSIFLLTIAAGAYRIFQSRIALRVLSR